MSTAEAVKQIRSKLNLSQQKFSDQLGVTVGTISLWETNKVTPMPNKLAALASMARTLELGEAADALEADAGVLFKTIGRDMLQHAWRQFLMIESALTEFGMRAEKEGFREHVPQDIWETLSSALQRAMDGKGYLEQAMATAAFVEPKC